MITTRVVSGSSSTVGVFSRMIDSYGSSGGLHIRHIFSPARAIVNQGPSHRHVNGHNSSAGAPKMIFLWHECTIQRMPRGLKMEPGFDSPLEMAVVFFISLIIGYFLTR